MYDFTCSLPKIFADSQTNNNENLLFVTKYITLKRINKTIHIYIQISKYIQIYIHTCCNIQNNVIKYIQYTLSCIYAFPTFHLELAFPLKRLIQKPMKLAIKKATYKKLQNPLD